MQIERTIGNSRPSSRALLQQDSPAPVSSREMSSPDSTSRMLRVVWERRWLVISCICLAIIAAAIYLSRATPFYSSSSRLFVQQTGPRIMADNGLSNGFSNTFLANQIELIRSPAILSAAANSPTLRSFKSFSETSNPIGLLLSMISVDVGKQNDILTVSAESADPLEAAAVANAVVDAYVIYQAQQRHSTAAEVLGILEKEKGKRDTELDQLTKAEMEFKKANGVLSFANDRGNIVTQRLGELSEALSSSQMDLLKAQMLKESVDAVGNDSRKIKQLMQAEFAKGVQINVAQDSSDQAVELKKLRSEFALLKATYGNDNKRIVEAQQEMESLKAEIEAADAQAAQDSRAVVDEIYNKAQKTTTALEKAFDEQRRAALDLSGKSAEYSKLESDERRAEKESDLLDSRIKEINVSEDAGAFSTSILEIAKAGSSPVRPLHSKILGEALVAGLLLGLGAAAARDWMDQRLRSVDEITSLLDTEVLGMIPSMPPKHSRSQRGQLVHTAPRSPIAESFRTIRTALYFGGASRMKTLLVTSPSPGDGKSTATSNLAIAMAQAGERVLLIDADCRRPTQHKIFELKSDVGLSDILMGGVSVDEAIQHTGIPNLDVLPCGSIPANPAEVLNSHEFNELVSRLSEQYDRVVLDSPPVIPVTDARILAASCDATILVLRAERSNRKLGIHTVDSLRAVGAVVLGAIVNDVSYRKGRYGYYAGYGYHMHYYGTDHVTPTNGSAASVAAESRALPAEPAVPVDSEN